MARGLIFLLSCLTFAAKAADLNLTGDEGSTSPAIAPCERLLDADLAGDYVVTNGRTQKSHLVRLRRLGAVNAYALSTLVLHLTRQGELVTDQADPNWGIDDEGLNKVNILTLKHSDGEMGFRFEDSTAPEGAKVLHGRPINEARGFMGNVLRPDGFVVDVPNQDLGAELRFTRVNFDHQVSKFLSQSLKSVLASQLQPAGGYGPLDYYLVAEMLRPMRVGEACALLNTEYTCSLDVADNPDQGYYRFLIPRTLYSLLENVQFWMAQPDIGRLDIIPIQVLNADVVNKVVARLDQYTPGESGLDPFRTERFVPSGMRLNPYTAPTIPIPIPASFADPQEEPAAAPAAGAPTTPVRLGDIGASGVAAISDALQLNLRDAPDRPNHFRRDHPDEQ